MELSKSTLWIGMKIASELSGSAGSVANESAAVVVGDPQDGWSTVLPRDWDDGVGGCWSASGEALYLYGGPDMAWTFDGGASWRRTVSEEALSPFCGFGAGFLWLQLEGLRVYRLPQQ